MQGEKARLTIQTFSSETRSYEAGVVLKIRLEGLGEASVVAAAGVAIITMNIITIVEKVQRPWHTWPLQLLRPCCILTVTTIS